MIELRKIALSLYHDGDPHALALRDQIATWEKEGGWPEKTKNGSTHSSEAAATTGETNYPQCSLAWQAVEPQQIAGFIDYLKEYYPAYEPPSFVLRQTGSETQFNTVRSMIELAHFRLLFTTEYSNQELTPPLMIASASLHEIVDSQSTANQYSIVFPRSKAFSQEGYMMKFKELLNETNRLLQSINNPMLPDLPESYSEI